MKVIASLKDINTPESYLGRMVTVGNSLLVPCFNINILDNIESKELKNYKQQYIKFGYLYFENISFITWDYDIAQQVKNDKTVCYGGEVVETGEFIEYWISSQSDSLIVDEQWEVREEPFPISEFEKKNLVLASDQTQLSNVLASLQPFKSALV